MMDKSLFDRLVQQLLPEMDDPAARKALLESALFGSPMLQKIDWTGAAAPLLWISGAFISVRQTLFTSRLSLEFL